MRNEKVTITYEPFKMSAIGSLIAFVKDPDGTLIELIDKKIKLTYGPEFDLR